MNKNQEIYSTKEVAQVLGISRIKKIQKGQIKAELIGHSYVINKNEIKNLLGHRKPDELSQA